MRRAWALAAFVAIAALAARCTFDGLDQYASGPGDAGDAGEEGDAVVDVSPSCAACTDAQACVQGKCETCTPTWSVLFPSTGVNAHDYEPATSTLYVSGAKQVGDAGATGYFAFVDTCTGTLERALDPPAIGDAGLGYLGSITRAGSTLYVGTAPPQPPNAGGFTRFDLGGQAFQSQVDVPQFSGAAHTDEIWQMVAAGADLWMSGTTMTEGSSAAAVVVKSNGSGPGCATPISGYTGNFGRAIAATPTDAWMAIAGTSIRVLHFASSSCSATAPCSCAPTWVSQPLTLTNDANTMGAHRSLLIGSTLYVAGWAIKQGSTTDWEGYVAQLDLASHAWGPTYTFDPTSAIDAIVNLATDGLRLYASAEQGWDGTSANYASASSKVIELPIPLVANPTPTVVDVPGLRVGWSIDVDATGMVLSGISATGTGSDGRSVRCTLASCPP
jgi:hypothetical protein